LIDVRVEVSLFERMLRIRRVEEAIADEYGKQEMRCPVHLSIGQEAVPVGLCAHLTDLDRVYSTHRCHAHYLAKDGSIPKMIAELYGRATGCNKGKGGSMHLIDVERGMMGGSALVGGSIPLAVGAALAKKMAGQREVSIAFFGDGGSEEGIFYESMNFAALHKLPVIFAVENNLYATYSHQNARQATPDIFRRGESFGIPGSQVDGNDVLAIYKAAKVAVTRARSGEGPTLFEFMTYRVRDHVGPASDVSVGYRTQEEVDKWLARCPVNRLKKHILDQGHAKADQLEVIETKISDEIKEAFAFAKASPYPSISEVHSEVYA
jgi:acetoin:2,6-dichlorophenolindophenol oxidoreductase subunit alpha